MKLVQRIPDALSLVFFIMIIFIILTWVIPAGSFEYRDIQGRMTAVPDTYSRTESSPQGLWALLNAPIKGFISAAPIIGFCFLVGGAFSVINRTGAINAGLARVIRMGENKSRYKKIILALIIVFFSISGASFGMSESVLVFIMITIPLALAMGYDSIVGISISFLAAGVGFAGALTNPFTIGIAQGLAGLEIFSGWEYRLLIWTIFTGLTILFVLRYATKVEKDPPKSPVFEIDQKRDRSEFSTGAMPEFNTRRKIVLYLFLASLVFLIIGTNVWKWYIEEIAALFVGISILSAVVYQLTLRDTTESFVKGAKDMMMAGLVIAMAKGLLVIASDGRIIDTMLQAMAQAVEGFPKVASAGLMFVFQGVLNFFLPSGSGQAALTIPIMAPLSDLIGITRQTAVLCFQMGDGIFNMIIPTSGVTMGVLSIAKIPYTKWVRWMIPFILVLVILVILFLIPPTLLFEYR